MAQEVLNARRTNVEESMRSAWKVWLVGGVVVLAGCSQEGGSGSAASGNGSSSGSIASGSSGSGGGSGSGSSLGQPGSSSGGSGSSRAGSSGPVPQPPVLESAAALQAGPTGADVVLKINVTDADRDLLGAEVVARDVNGMAVMAFDADGDGAMDLTTTTLGLGTQGAGGALAFWLRGLHQVPGVSQVSLTVSDRAGHTVMRDRVLISAQQVRALEATCDAAFVEDRCDTGAFCRGMSSTCQPPVAPTLTRVAYLRSELGARLLVQGTDPDLDVTSLHLQWLDSMGMPISVDQDGDGSADGDSLDLMVPLQRDARFFVENVAGSGFETLVNRVTVTAVDLGGLMGTPMTATLANTPVRGAGQACDALGFDACGTGLVCSPGQVGVSNTCRQAASMRAGLCGSAPVLSTAANGLRVVTGMADGASVWDPPQGCATNDPVGRPEYVARLRVAEAVSQLTLSTDHPATSFDTVLYLLRACGDTANAAMACSDDVETSATSRLTLNALAAGDYIVVVDSFGPQGGYVELTLDITP